MEDLQDLQVLQETQALQAAAFPPKETKVQSVFLDYRAGREVKASKDPLELWATRAFQAQKVIEVLLVQRVPKDLRVKEVTWDLGVPKE